MTPAKDKPAAAVTYPRQVFQPTHLAPGFRTVTVTDASSEKALKPPGFATKAEALAYNAPLDQPIPHITRTANEEQWDDRKSQAGRNLPSGVIRTEAPVQNVPVTTGINPDTLAVTAALPDGIDPQAITAHSAPGALYAPPDKPPEGAPAAPAPKHT